MEGSGADWAAAAGRVGGPGDVGNFYANRNVSGRRCTAADVDLLRTALAGAGAGVNAALARAGAQIEGVAASSLPPPPPVPVGV